MTVDSINFIFQYRVATTAVLLIDLVVHSSEPLNLRIELGGRHAIIVATQKLALTGLVPLAMATLDGHDGAVEPVAAWPRVMRRDE
jgi:hypothetical protein